jgi:[acyl-carrier-protein] S-malonyltransferase
MSELEARMAHMRASDRACVLPRADTREGRQLRRWVAHVLLVEQVCVDELSRRGVDWTGEQPPGMPSRTDAVALGSIVAAAWSGHPAVRHTALIVTQDVRLSPRAVESLSRLGVTDGGGLAWTADELLVSQRLDAFSRWLARATHERVVLVPGLEHPGDSRQPDNLHRH